MVHSFIRSSWDTTRDQIINGDTKYETDRAECLHKWGQRNASATRLKQSHLPGLLFISTNYPLRTSSSSPRKTNTMSSSLFDGLHSDNVYSDLPFDDRARQRRAPSSRPRSSSRPRGPPSESAGGAPSDADGLLDDDAIAAQEILRRRGATQRQDVERVTDSIGEAVASSFEVFLEK